MTFKHRIGIVVSLLCLSCLVQVVLIRRATVPGLDAVRFVHIAQSIDRQGLLPTVRQETEQPLFPVCVWLVHEGLERTLGEFRSAWGLSAQLAAAVALVLTVVPVYFLAERLVGSAAALAGSLLFCVLPRVARLGADGISDSTHLLFFSLALWALVVYLSRVQGSGARDKGSGFRVQGDGSGRCDGESPRAASRGTELTGRNRLWLLAAGMATAVALLARGEVLMLPAALAVTLAVFQFQHQRRQPWFGLAAALGCFLLGAGAVLGPYLVAVGSVAPRSAVARVLGRETPETRENEASPPAQATATVSALGQLAGGEPMSFAPKDPTTSLRRRGLGAAIAHFGEALAGAFTYWVGALALFGLWRLRLVPARAADWLVRVFFVMFSLAGFHFAAGEGYLSSRHLVPLVVTGIGCAGYGALELGRRTAKLAAVKRLVRAGLHHRNSVELARSSLGWALVLLSAVACSADMVRPLHVSRLGHRLAAEWLAVQTNTPGTVLDTRGWTGLYSGRPTFRYEDAQSALDHSQLAYLVLEARELEFDSRRSRTLHHLLDTACEQAATFPHPAARNRRGHAVLIYRWCGDRFSGRADSRPVGYETKKD